MPALSLASSIDKLAEILRGFQPRSVAKFEEYGILAVDLSSLFRRLQGRTHILVMTYAFAEDMLTNDPQWIEDQFLNLTDARYSRAGLAPIFLLGRPANKQSGNFVHSGLSSLEFLQGQPVIVADSIFDRKKDFDLRRLLLSLTDYRVLSPYRIDEYAGSGMFFGREQDLMELRSGRSNLILAGSRRIGKSSLAMRLKETMGYIKLPAIGFKHLSREIPRCIYLDVSAIAKPVSRYIWDAILRRFEIKRGDLSSGGWRSDLLGKRPKGDGAASFDEAKAVQFLIGKFEGKLTIILDEVDSWIHEESGLLWPSLDKLRSFTDNGRARVILVGYESLAVAARYHKFPLAARGASRLLGPIDFEAVKNLILEPLAELDIEIEPRSREPILNRIWKTTSGFPHLVQDICGNIVKLTLEDRGRNDRKKPNPVTLALVESAISQSNALKAFIDRIVDKDFPLARAIAAACATSEDSSAAGKEAAGSRPMTISEIAEVLETSGSGFLYSDGDFDLALTALELRSVLQPANPERTRWMWVNEMARQSMKNSINDIGRKRFIEDLIHEHQKDLWRESFKKLHWSGGGGHSIHSKGATR